MVATSIRWYSAELDPVMLRLITASMIAAEYQVNGEWGFRLSERRKSHVAGTYYERLLHVDEVADPLGGVTQYERVEFRKVSFVLRSGFPALEVRGAARGAGDFFKRIGVCAGDSLRISPIRASVPLWLAALERDACIQVLGLRVADLTLDPKTSAVVKIDGTADVRDVVQRFLGRRSYRIKSAVVRWPQRGEDAICEIGELGRVRFQQGQQSKAERAVRLCLAASFESQQ